MSIIDTFDDKTDAVINPSQIAPPITDFPKVAMVTTVHSERLDKSL